MVRRILTLAAAAACCASPAFAQTEAPAPKRDTWVPIGGQPKTDAPAAPKADGPTLAIGDRAPSLKIANWVKGQPVTEFEMGKVYVVEFWATWCPPCKKSIPHLTELQKRFADKGVTIIGISGKDRNGETLEKVEAFAKDYGDKMAYTVAFDDERKTNEAYMKAAQQRGIPTAFVVNQFGQVAWIGHPTHPEGELDEVLARVVAGKFTPEDAKSFKSESGKKDAAASELQSKVGRHMQAGEHAEAIKALEELMKADPARASQYAATKFQIMLTEMKDYTGAYAYGNEIVTGAIKGDAMALNAVGWTILDAPGLDRRDFDLAVKAATRADELTKSSDPAIMDTLALAHFEKGNVDKAIEIQTKAVELATDDAQMKEELEGRLKKFQDKKAGK